MKTITVVLYIVDTAELNGDKTLEGVTLNPKTKSYHLGFEADPNDVPLTMKFCKALSNSLLDTVYEKLGIDKWEEYIKDLDGRQKECEENERLKIEEGIR